VTPNLSYTRRTSDCRHCGACVYDDKGSEHEMNTRLRSGKVVCVRKGSTPVELDQNSTRRISSNRVLATARIRKRQQPRLDTRCWTREIPRGIQLAERPPISATIFLVLHPSGRPRTKDQRRKICHETIKLGPPD